METLISIKTQSIENSVYTDERFQTETSVDHIGMDKVINNLEEKYKVLIDLVYFRGYTQKEVEEELEMPIGTVKTRLRAAIKELRKILVQNKAVSFLAGILTYLFF